MKTCVLPSGQKWFSVSFSGWNYLRPTYCKNALKRCSLGWILWLHGEFKIKIIKYAKRDQKIKSWGPTFLGLNLAKMGLNFEAPAHPFHPGAPNGGIYMNYIFDIYMIYTYIWYIIKYMIYIYIYMIYIYMILIYMIYIYIYIWSIWYTYIWYISNIWYLNIYIYIWSIFFYLIDIYIYNQSTQNPLTLFKLTMLLVQVCAIELRRNCHVADCGWLAGWLPNSGPH